MKLTWLGHACFLIEEEAYRIVIDPYEENIIQGYKLPYLEADEVLVSHEHLDHNARNRVRIRAVHPENPFNTNS